MRDKSPLALKTAMKGGSFDDLGYSWERSDLWVSIGSIWAPHWGPPSAFGASRGMSARPSEYLFGSPSLSSSSERLLGDHCYRDSCRYSSGHRFGSINTCFVCPYLARALSLTGGPDAKLSALPVEAVCDHLPIRICLVVFLTIIHLDCHEFIVNLGFTGCSCKACT